MNKALIEKAETLLDELSEMLTSGNHSAETLTALVSLKAAAGPALRKAATRTTLDGGNPDDAATAALRAKLGIGIEGDASGALTEVTTLDELLASWDTRLANAVKNAASHPIAKQRAYDEELLRMVKELRAFQNSEAAIQAALPVRHVSAEMAARKSAGAESVQDLILEAQQNSRSGAGASLGFRR